MEKAAGECGGLPLEVADVEGDALSVELGVEDNEPLDEAEADAETEGGAVAVDELLVVMD